MFYDLSTHSICLPVIKVFFCSKCLENPHYLLEALFHTQLTSEAAVLFTRVISFGKEYALEERDHCCQNAAIGVRVKLEKMQGGRTLNTKIMTPRAKYK
jgi:hypothetical protein